METRKRKVIIIGNGFDIACGLPTRYEDFMHASIMDCIGDVSKYREMDECSFSNSVFTIKTGDGWSNWPQSVMRAKEEFQDGKSLKCTIDILKNSGVFLSSKDGGLGELMVNMVEPVNWLNIELAYLQALQSVIGYDSKKSLNPSIVSRLKQKVQVINIEFNNLKAELERYILKVENESVRDGLISYESIFESLRGFFKRLLFDYPNSDGQNDNRYLIVDFNYTSTMAELVKRMQCESFIGKNQLSYVQIHGKASEKGGGIIFGFGNDQSKSYQELKELEIPELREGMKSLSYSFSGDYAKLKDFTSPFWRDDLYDVHIIGHSCGNTDQTLLKPILTSNSCRRIFLYNHDGEKGERAKLLNLDLFFNSQEELLSKVDKYNSERKLPQLIRN